MAASWQIWQVDSLAPPSGQCAPPCGSGLERDGGAEPPSDPPTAAHTITRRVMARHRKVLSAIPHSRRLSDLGSRMSVQQRPRERPL